MFRIECFVEDKHLAKAMRALAGIAHDLKAVPVVNATVSKGKIVAKSDLVEVFRAHIGKRKLAEVTPDIAREFLSSVGYSPLSYTSLLRQAIGKGLLVASGTTSNMRYVVKKAGAK